MRFYGTRNTAHNPHADPPHSPPTEAWSASAPGVKALVVADGTVFAGGDDGTVALDVTDGTERWRAPAPAGVLCVDGDTVFALGDGKPTLTALDVESGDQRWQSQANSQVGNSLHVGGDTLYVGLDARVEARSPDSGALRWAKTMPGRGWANVALTEDELYATGPGQLAALKPREAVGALVNGGPRVDWQQEPPLTGSAPTVTADAVIVGARDPQDPSQRARAYDPAAGELRWRSRPLGDLVSPAAITGDAAYVGAGTWTGDSSEGSVVALDHSTGDVVWRYPTDYGVTPPITAGDAVFAGTYDESGPVVALDAASGDVLWRTEFPGATGRLAAVGDALYVGTLAGSVHALAR